LYRDPEGLIIVDYKTDAVPVAALDARIGYYRPQMAAYALAIEAATDHPVVRCMLLFLTPTGVHHRDIDALDTAKRQVTTFIQTAGDTVGS
ncbi:PD-(D/E)XK nuclease family protein, partial [Escherichia coli]|uniref:PD-(D/E)XK nuclease family protein n=1 Tax=Escherichia coli TaxID=562 RepID=UPI0021139295